ncbi:hypothetical protein PGT21_015378 [Puccinia graminis f. sp. tritici]|uniref:Thioredoxin domain-containing protein n=1 Tax=Puccinia graminis f. sp. tritici TaxID=56615 RepID=A0A5B0NDS4_PUCGR|nr:hypothetical protein PGT21_015378 [Puccinia graminis f. sp. tritici]
MKALAISNLILLAATTTTFVVEAAVQLHAGVQLNENNFDATVKQGLWFLECYSPFCPHCKRFAPTWIQVVDKMKHYEDEGLKLGQVDCIAQGDLCIRLNIEFYPQMKLYEDGQVVESYSGEKDVEAIAKYLEQKVEWYQSRHPDRKKNPLNEPPEGPTISESTTESTDTGKPDSSKSTPSSPSSSSSSSSSSGSHPSDHPVSQPDSDHPAVIQPATPTTPTTTTTTTTAIETKPKIQTHTPIIQAPNPLGQIIVLDHFNWNSFINPSITPHPLFIHFQTAWCKECRKLTPVWEETARLLKEKANVAQIDCDLKENKELCNSQHVTQFPSFILYHDGIKLDYTGPKAASKLIEFVEKAISTPGSHEMKSLDEFDQAVEKKNLFFLFLHSSGTPLAVIEAIRTVGKGFLGSTEIMKTGNQAIYERLELPSSRAYLLVFKENERRPWAKLELEEGGGGSKDERQAKLTQAIQHWIALHSIPILAQLDRQNLHRIFNSGARKLVVLLCLNHPSRKPDDTSLDKNPEAVALREQAKLWAVQWRKSQLARDVDVPIDWVWLDAQEWSDWLYDSYGVILPKPSKEGLKESSTMLVVDPYHHLYFDHQENRAPISFKPTSIFQTLLAIEIGKVGGNVSGSFGSRMGWRFHRLTHSIKTMIGPHYVILWMMILIIVILWLKTSQSQRRRGSGGYNSLSPQPSKPFLHSSSSSSNDSGTLGGGGGAGKPPGFATVFGLNSNVAFKAD